MAKKKGRRGSPSTASARAAGRSLEAFLGLSPVTAPPRPFDLFADPIEGPLSLEDRREFYPPTQSISQDLAWSPPAALPRFAARLVVSEPVAPSRATRSYAPPLLSPLVRFADPRGVSICARRQARKEVIHASGQAGRPGRRSKPKRTPYSAISCKRR